MPTKQTQKSILEETFAEIASIKESLSNNASALLNGNLKSELQNVVANAIKEAKEFNFSDDDENPEMDDDTTPAGGDEPEIPSDDIDISGGDEDDMAGGLPADTNPEGLDMPEDDMPPMDGTEFGDEEIVDLTGKSDAEVLQVFKKMSPEDEIEVIKNAAGDIELNVSGEEYIIKTTEGELPMDDDMGMGAEMGMDAEPDFGGDAEMGTEMGTEPDFGDDTEMGTEPDFGGNPEVEDDEELVAEGDHKQELARVRQMGNSQGAGDRTDVKSAPAKANPTVAGKSTIHDNEHASHGKRSDVSKAKVTADPTRGGGGKHVDSNVTANYDKGRSDRRTDVKSPKVTADPTVGGEGGTLEAGIPNKPNYDRGTKSTPVDADPKVKSNTTVGIAEQLKRKLDENHNKLVYTRQKYAEAVADNANLRDHINSLNENVTAFKASETGYKNAIQTLREQFSEVALFTSNLTYAVKLMTEHATTKEEKTQILERFETAKNLGESKVIYESIAASFGAPKKKVQSIDEQINRNASSGASAINESVAYQSPELSRMKELMTKMK